RVPAIAMGPFAPRKIEQAGPYEHCSIPKMIEWRWSLRAMTLRDRSAKKFARALDLSTHRAPLALPRLPAPPPRACLPRWTGQEMPVSRRGWVTRVVDPPSGGSIRRARIVKVDETGEKPGQPYSKRTRKRYDDEGKLVLRMRLNEDARKAVAGA